MFHRDFKSPRIELKIRRAAECLSRVFDISSQSKQKLGRIYANRPRSIYQYSNMAPRLPGQTSIFGVVFFVSKSLLRVEEQKKLENCAILIQKPRSHPFKNIDLSNVAY